MYSRASKIATGKGWKVLAPDGKEFVGVNGLEDISASQRPISLVSKEGMLQISGLEAGMPIVVYTIDGTAIYRTVGAGEEVTIALPAAAYILHLGNYSGKTIIL